MKYALVTGGSRGIGRAICLKLAGMGIPVIINFKSNIEAARELREAILAEGGEASLMQFDVADPQAVSSALAAWEKEHPDDYWLGSSYSGSYDIQDLEDSPYYHESSNDSSSDVFDSWDSSDTDWDRDW